MYVSVRVITKSVAFKVFNACDQNHRSPRARVSTGEHGLMNRDANLPEKRVKFWAMLLTVYCISLGNNLLMMHQSSQHPDELNWASRAYFYRLAFIDHDLASDRWYLIDSLDQPHICDFLIGFAFHVSGQRIPDIPEHDWFWNGLPPLDPARLWYARMPGTLLGSFVAPIIFIFGCLISTRQSVFITGMAFWVDCFRLDEPCLYYYYNGSRSIDCTGYNR